jgi:hypothetical protein
LSVEKEAQLFNVSPRLVDDTHTVLAEASPEIVAHVERGKVSVSHAAKEIRASRTVPVRQSPTSPNRASRQIALQVAPTADIVPVAVEVPEWADAAFDIARHATCFAFSLLAKFRERKGESGLSPKVRLATSTDFLVLDRSPGTSGPNQKQHAAASHSLPSWAGTPPIGAEPAQLVRHRSDAIKSLQSEIKRMKAAKRLIWDRRGGLVDDTFIQKQVDKGSDEIQRLEQLLCETTAIEQGQIALLPARTCLQFSQMMPAATR